MIWSFTVTLGKPVNTQTDGGRRKGRGWVQRMGERWDKASVGWGLWGRDGAEGGYTVTGVAPATVQKV